MGMEKVVRVFQNFETADMADVRERQSMTPEQRVEVFLGLKQRTFRTAADEKLARVCRVLTLEMADSGSTPLPPHQSGSATCQ